METKRYQSEGDSNQKKKSWERQYEILSIK